MTLLATTSHFGQLVPLVAEELRQADEFDLDVVILDDEGAVVDLTGGSIVERYAEFYYVSVSGQSIGSSFTPIADLPNRVLDAAIHDAPNGVIRVRIPEDLYPREVDPNLTADVPMAVVWLKTLVGTEERGFPTLLVFRRGATGPAAPPTPDAPLEIYVVDAGIYENNHSFRRGSIVSFGGNLFLAVADVPDTNTSQPTDGAVWRNLTSGGSGGSGAAPVVYAQPYAANITLDANNGDVFETTATGDATLTGIDNLADGEIREFRWKQGGNGGHKLTFGAGIKNAYKGVPTPSTARGAVDVYWFEQVDGYVQYAGRLAGDSAPRVLTFAALAGNTHPTISDGAIGFFDVVGTTVLQAGSIRNVGTVYVPKLAAAYNADTGSVDTDLSTTRLTALFDDIVRRVGTDTILLLTPRGTTTTAIVQFATIADVGDGYRLQDPYWAGDDFPVPDGTSVNVIASMTHGVTTAGILDWAWATQSFITRLMLEGHENDQYAAYNSALFGANYFSGAFCLFNQTTEPADDTNVINRPDIATGSGVIVFGDLRSDANPDAAFTPQALDASAWPSGRVIHISPWSPYEADVYLTVTLTTAAAKVGAGNTERLWARADWVEHGNIKEAHDYFRWSEVVPSGLDAVFPYSVIADPPWVLLDGSNITPELRSDIQGPSEPYTVTEAQTRNANNAGQPAVDNQYQFAATPALGVEQQMLWRLDAANYAEVLSRWAIGKRIEFADGALRIASGASKFAGTTLQAAVVLVDGTLPAVGNATARPTVRGVPTWEEVRETVRDAANASSERLVSEKGIRTALDAVGTEPVTADISTVTDVTEADTDLVTGASADDLYLIVFEGAWSNETDNVVNRTIFVRFGSIPTTHRWVTVRGGTGGARFMYKRVASGGKIQVRRAGAIAASSTITAYRLKGGG